VDKSKYKSIYKIIEELENEHENKINTQASQASQASQDALSLCNSLNNFGTLAGREASQGRPIDILPEGAELISSSLQYLNGISDDLTGWTLWRQIEQGREHRFATDAAGLIRWERWYLRKEGN